MAKNAESLRDDRDRAARDRVSAGQAVGQPHWLAHGVVLLTCAYLVYYLGWRATATLNMAALPLSLVLLAAEAYGVWSFVGFAFMVWDTSRSPRFEWRSGLTVDVLVPTYNEDLEILEATLTGCGLIAYPHTTYVLDDGRRPEVAALASRLGCQYLTRADNRHAKAGNLNAALGRTNGAFVVVLDADTVPQPDLLDRTLGYFADPRVALVQLPQEFYNLDSVQHMSSGAAEAWHEQELFYRVIQPGKNRWNSAFWCGSPSVVRRAALEDVGGVATETVTEDIHTSVRLHARGWRTVYHDEALAFGVAPQTLHAFSVQRLRWAQGTMQLLRSPENPLIVPGLTPAQRLNYLASMSSYFDAYQKLVLLLLPPVILITGLLPFRVTVADYVLHSVPAMLLPMLASIGLGRGRYRVMAIEQYNVLKVFTFAWASTVLLWPRELRFRVTPKQTDSHIRTSARERLLVLPHLSLLGIIAVGFAIGAINLERPLTAHYASPAVAVVIGLWGAFGAALLLYAIVGVLLRTYRRRHYRFPVRLAVTVTPSGGPAELATVEDLSLHGCSVAFPEGTSFPRGPVTLAFHLPGGPIEAKGTVVHEAPENGGVRRVGVKLEDLAPSDRQCLIAFLFVTLPRTEGRARAEVGVLSQAAAVV